MEGRDVQGEAGTPTLAFEERGLWSAACVLMAVGLAAPVEAGASLVAIAVLRLRT